MVDFSEQQAAALRAAERWLDGQGTDQVFRLFGPAGTGKTTLAKHLAARADHPVFCAFTGKAALVMRRNGCANASTIHSLIYISRNKSKQRLRELEMALAEIISNPQPGSGVRIRELREDIEAERANIARPAFTLNYESDIRNADLVVVDECSMVDGRIGEDLLQFGIKTLVLGDPAQLPPVMGGGFFTSGEPDVMLTQIHRQAADNPIIKMATTVREGGKLLLGDYGESRVIEWNDLSMDEKRDLMREADQILVGRNATRHVINRRMRALLGRDADPLPVPGDKLVCLRNDHDVGVLNGSIWRVNESVRISEQRQMLALVSDDEEQTEVEVEAHSILFRGASTMAIDLNVKREAQEFDYGYALTVHKSQGSEWRNVVLIDEWRRDDWKQWCYTGITRAAEKLTVVRGF
jgi:exodeoxyribonuclease-5